MLPHEVLVEGDTDPERSRPRLRKVDGIHGAVAPDSRTGGATARRWSRPIPIPDSGTGEARTRSTACATRRTRSAPTSASAASPRSNADFIDAVYGNFPLMIALIAITTFILLARAFRSLLLPLKAIVLNILSVAAAWGVLVLVWQHGYGSEAIFGIEATGSIPSWMPLMIFAFLFGLSMDYEVFILVPHARGVRPHRLDRDRRWCAASAAPGGWSRAPR